MFVALQNIVSNGAILYFISFNDNLIKLWNKIYLFLTVNYLKI